LIVSDLQRHLINLVAKRLPLPGRALARLAAQLAAAPRPGVAPGWRFGAGEETLTPTTVLRLALLRRIRQRPVPPPILYNWMEALILELHLDNEFGRHLYMNGTIEPNELALIGRVLEPGMTFIDVGANEGVFALLAARRVGDAGRVIAIEPSRRELGRLRRNIALNGFANVRVIEAALAEVPGSLALHVADDEHAGHNTLGAFAYESVHVARSEAVPALTMDEVVAGVGGGRADIVKMDIEGAELRALRGASATLREARPLILLEISERSLAAQRASTAEVLYLLAHAGYEIYSFDAASGLPRPSRPGQPLSDNIVAMHRERRFEAAATA
jgi:FkbM family methyltransferase